MSNEAKHKSTAKEKDNKRHTKAEEQLETGHHAAHNLALSFDLNENLIKLSETLMHPPQVLETVGHIFPPLRLATETLVVIFDVAGTLMRGGRKLPLAGRVGLGLAIVTLLALSIAFPPLAGFFAVAACSAAIIKRSMGLAENIYDYIKARDKYQKAAHTFNETKNLLLSQLVVQPDEIVKLLEQQANDKGIDVHLKKTIVELLREHGLPHLDTKISDHELVREIKHLKIHSEKFDPANTGKLNCETIMEQVAYSRAKMQDAAQAITAQRRNMIKSANFILWGIISLVGVGLLFSPAAPAGIALLVIATAGGLASGLAIFAYEKREAAKKEMLEKQLTQEEALFEEKDSETLVMQELKQHAHEEAIQSTADKQAEFEEEQIPAEIPLTSKVKAEPQPLKTEEALQSATGKEEPKDEEGDGDGEHPRAG